MAAARLEPWPENTEVKDMIHLKGPMYFEFGPTEEEALSRVQDEVRAVETVRQAWHGLALSVILMVLVSLMLIVDSVLGQVMLGTACIGVLAALLRED